MSWITGLADKAENILNKIDQNALTALSSPIGNSVITNTLEVKTKLTPVKQHVQYESTSGIKKDLVYENSRKTERMVAKNMNVNQNFDHVVLNETINDKIEKCSRIASKQELVAIKIDFNNITSKTEFGNQPSSLNHYEQNKVVIERVSELENYNKQLLVEYNKLKNHLDDIQITNKAYVDCNSELENNFSKLYEEYRELQNKMFKQVNEIEEYRHELQEYRTKAQHTLLIKDNLIAELKAANSIDKRINLNNSDAHCLQIQYNSLKLAKEQEAKNSFNLKLQLETLQNDIVILRREQTELLKQQNKNEESLNKQLHLARERNFSLESEHRLCAKELNSLREQLSNQLIVETEHLQQEDHKLETYRKFHGAEKAIVNNKTLTEENNVRLKALTQALFDKQNTIEKLTTEVNALRIQLENIKKQSQKSLQKEKVTHTHDVGINTLLLINSDIKAKFPRLIKASPFDNHVARRVKSAYSSVDSAGIRLGIFLRRYPLMRISVLVYIALLHIWVMFVLLWSTTNLVSSTIN